MIQATGDTSTDIQNIINELALQGQNNFTDLLQIVSYGSFNVTVPNVSQDTIYAVSHGLGYAPIYFLKILGGDGFSRDLPFIQSTYFYNSGSQAQGSYAYNRFLTYVDTDNLYLEVDNLPNPGNFVVSGNYVLTYYIFNRPITS